MRQRLLYYLSNGRAIKFPCKWPMPHFILIYGILIEFVSLNWKILLFNVCIAVADQAAFNEIMSQWPWGGGGEGRGHPCVPLTQSRMGEGGGGGQRSLACFVASHDVVLGSSAGGMDEVCINWWGSHYRIQSNGVWCRRRSKYCDLKLCCAVLEEMNRRIIAHKCRRLQTSSRVTKTWAVEEKHHAANTHTHTLCCANESKVQMFMRQVRFFSADAFIINHYIPVKI